MPALTYERHSDRINKNDIGDIYMNEIHAVIEFTDGKTVNLELYPEAAPETVKNFADLARKGFYDGLCMHRVIPGFMIQGGGMTYEKNKLVPKKAPRNIVGEFTANGRKNDIKHKAGVISMARTAVPDSASSQFFICVEDCPHLDGQYAAFGKVTGARSLDAAVEISNVPTRSVDWYDDVPVTPVVIKTVSITD